MGRITAMNKKQLGAFLKVMSKDDSRPILCTAKVDRYKDDLVMVATDGYVLAAVKLDEDARELEGKLIRRSALEKWYKLATGKSRLTSDELISVSSDDYGQNGGYQDGDYPQWQNLVPQTEPEGQDTMHFNADFFKTIQDLDGQNSVRVKLYGRLSPMVFETERGLYLAMPMKV